jgi:predicted Zn-dependent protease
MSFDDEMGVLFIPPDLYMRAEDNRWYVLSPWDQGIPRDELPEFGPDAQIIDYGWITDELSDIEQLADGTIDGETYMRYGGTINPTESSSENPSDTIGLRPFGIAGTLDIELWLHEETYLPRKMHVSVRSVGGESNSLTDVTFEFFDYDQPITLPERPEGARPWRDLDMPEAPCTGAAYAQCLEFQDQLQSIAQDSCKGTDKHVCLVPLGQVSPALVQNLVDYYKGQYGLTITVLTPSAVPADIADPLREQIDAATLISYMGSLFMDEYSDPNVVLIGITPVDLYDKESHFRYLFGLKGTPTSPQAVMSTFRMNPAAYGETADDDLLFSRARKLLTKYIGILYYGLTPSDDPESPLYDSILSTADLDDMGEPLPIAGDH